MKLSITSNCTVSSRSIKFTPEYCPTFYYRLLLYTLEKRFRGRLEEIEGDLKFHSTRGSTKEVVDYISNILDYSHQYQSNLFVQFLNIELGSGELTLEDIVLKGSVRLKSLDLTVDEIYSTPHLKGINIKVAPVYDYGTISKLIPPSKLNLLPTSDVVKIISGTREFEDKKNLLNVLRDTLHSDLESQVNLLGDL